MPAKRTHDALATIGEYTDRETGKNKKQRINVGVVFTDDEGRMSLKLNAVPVIPGWSGFVSLFPIRENQDRPSRRETYPAPLAPRTEPEDDDIPF